VLQTKGAGANPEWGDLTTAGSPATGDVLYFDGTDWVVLAPGTSGDVLTSNGAGAAPTYQTPAGTAGVQSFITSGTFTVPAGITTVFVTACAGGGGGGYGNNGITGGGGGGEAIVNYPYTVTPGANLTVTVGTGGARAPSGASSSGSGGTNTVFDSITLVAGGGGHGTPGSGTAQGGGTVRAAVVDTPGGHGDRGGNGADKAGGGSLLGRGGAPGEDGQGHGGGGGGGNINGFGGNGADGIVVVNY